MTEDETIKSAIKSTTTLLKLYQGLCNAYVSDFFVHEHHQLIKESWWVALSNLQPPELAVLLSENEGNATTRTVWPLSLLAFVKANQALSLTRHVSETRHDLNIKGFHIRQEIGTEKPCISDGQMKTLDHSFRRHVKPKKQHEIQQLTKVINCMCNLSHSDHVIDVGAGLGHLSRLLSFGYRLKVTTLEAAGGHAPKALKFDSELQKDISKGKVSVSQSEAVASPEHLTLTLHSDITPEDFLEVIRSSSYCQNPNSETNNGMECVSDEVPSELKQKVSGASGDLKEKRMSSCSCCECGQMLVSSLGRCENCNLSLEPGSWVCEGCRLNTAPSSSEKNNDSAMLSLCNSPSCANEKPGWNQEQKEIGSNKHSTLRQSDQHVVECGTKGVADTCKESFVMAALHACGDLTPTLLRLFVKCPQAVGLVSVPCCYMKLTCSEKRTSSGYPLSQFVQNLDDNVLSWEAREMACHSMDVYAEKLRASEPSLKSHCYRAALQSVMERTHPHFEKGTVKVNVKNCHQMSFKEYLEKAMKKLKVSTSGVDEDTLTSAELLLDKWKDLVIFYTLRLSMSPVIESLILLDRLLYLRENGVESCLVPVFDPTLSPRNIALLAVK